MKYLLSLFLVSLLYYPVSGQYYLRGELKDEQGNALAHVQIHLSSKGNYPYKTGSSGDFGIPSSVKTDTIIFTAPGFDTLKSPVITSQFNSFTLKACKRNAQVSTLHISSVTKNLPVNLKELIEHNGETYSSSIENQFVGTQANPETTIGLHIDKASYSNIRRFITSKEKPPADAVRIEEMLNYFNFKMQQANKKSEVFSYASQITSCPWNAQNQLLFINLQAKKINLEKTPPANLVFLIDVSGSMDMPNRLPLLKNAFKLLTENLRSTDLVSIVTYGDRVTVQLPPTRGDKQQKILEAIEGLVPSGATPGASAIKTAYNQARSNFIPNGNNRVILASDGDFNVGQTSDKDLENIISHERKTGVYLSCLGVGMGNYKDSKLEALAKAGNGNFSYLDTEKEAEKVLVEEFAQTLYSVANDVSLNIKFNPEVVSEYRLIGYDNNKSALAAEDTELEGGEIGSGQSLVAVFEIKPQDTSAKALDTHVANVNVTYKLPVTNVFKSEDYTIKYNYVPLSNSDKNLQLAASLIMFGTQLKQSEFAKSYSWDDIISVTTAAINPDNLLHQELVELMNKAKKMYRR